MTVTFSADEVIEALYVGLLGRQPDPVGRASYKKTLEEGPGALVRVVDSLSKSVERKGVTLSPDDIVDALYIAVLGRTPDEKGRAAYSNLIQADPSAKALKRIGAAIFNSPEHQDRLLPADFIERALIDHSPNGEFVAMVQHLIGRSYGRGLMVEVGVSAPSMSASLDFLKLSGWRGILIEPSPELRLSIESRFSGLDFELIQARVLDVGGEIPAPQGVAPPSAAGLGLAKSESGGPNLVELASVLANSGVPSNFAVLIISRARNTIGVTNSIFEASEYRPDVLIVHLEAPRNWTTFSQLGLSERIEASYTVVVSTQRSVMLARR